MREQRLRLFVSGTGILSISLSFARGSIGIRQNSSFAGRFTREARALGRLNHPNIVGIYDSGSVNGLYYFVMEYVDGANLRQILQAKTLAPKDVLAIVPQVCEALQFAHAEGVVHRDIKPENILIDKKGRVKIADFGLAKLISTNPTDAKLTGTNQVMGTLPYMAPEQIEGARDIDHRADIYSLGVVFYELLTGELPPGRFAPPSQRVTLDVRLDQIVLRTLEKSPEQRYQQAGDVKTEVETVVRTPDVPPGSKNANPTKSIRTRQSTGWFKRHLQRLVQDLDEIDHFYLGWIAFSLASAVGFYVFTAIVLISKGKYPNRLDDILYLGMIWTVMMFILLNLLWLICWLLGVRQKPDENAPTSEEIEKQLRQAGSVLSACCRHSNDFEPIQVTN